MTAEVPDLPDGCRVMNPVPVRLPIDIEVCGVEKLYARNLPAPHKYTLVSGYSPDLKFTGEELLAMFEILGSTQCPIKEFSLMNAGSDTPMSTLFSNNIFITGAINGTNEELLIKNNII